MTTPPIDPSDTPDLPDVSLIGLSIGNTRTRVGVLESAEVRASSSIMTREPVEIAAEALAFSGTQGELPGVIALAGGDVELTDAVSKALASSYDGVVARLAPHNAATLAPPIKTTVDEPERVGQDRLLCALAAHYVGKQACVVVDAGTAVTIDFVDGEGVFHGGIIMPGCQSMLDAMHASAQALPKLELSALPDPLQPFGRNTEHAMLLGVVGAVRGAVRHFTEKYAEFYEAYPQVIATGGDAQTLFEGDELVEAIVPDLQLIGLGLTAAHAAREDEA